jgi:hypothetical protein
MNVQGARLLGFGRVGMWAMAAAFCLSLCTRTVGQIPCRYEVAAVIPAPPCPFVGPPPTIGTGISPNGRYVCGYWYQCDTGYKAFLFDTTTNQFTTLPFPPGVTTTMTAAAVNDSGMVVGQMINDAVTQYQGFVWNSQTGQYTTLVPLSAHGWAAVNSISNSNVVCGFRSIGSPSSQINPYQAFIWSAAKGYTDLGVMVDPGSSGECINSAGYSVGRAGNPVSVSERAFAYLNGGLVALPPIPGGISSWGVSINEYGVLVIGGLIQSSPLIKGLYVTDQVVWKRLLPLTGDAHANSYPSGVAKDGTVFGDSQQSLSGPWRACLWRDGLAIELQTIVTGLASGTLEGAIAVSRTDQVAVNGIFPGGEPLVFLLSPILSMSGDTNCDQRVNIDDLLNVITHWGPCNGCGADQTRNGIVDIDDLLFVILHWSH